MPDEILCKTSSSKITASLLRLVKKRIMETTTVGKEGKIAKAIESITSEIPSDAFLWAGLGALGAALTLQIMGKKHTGLFIGQWAAPLLLFGIYDKMVKLQGHDQEDKGNSDGAL
jgi:hypothetical protein